MGLNFAGVAAGYRGYADETARLANEDRRNKAEQRADQDATFQEEARGRQRIDWQEQDRIKAADKRDLATVNAKYDTAADTGDNEADLALAQKQAKDEHTQAQIAAALAVPPDPAVAAITAAPLDSVVTGTTPKWAKPAGAIPIKVDSPVLDPSVSAKLSDLAPPAGMPKPRNFSDALAKQADLLRMKSDRGDIKLQDYAQGMQLLNTLRAEGVNDALKAFSAGDYQGGMDAFNQTGRHNGARILSGIEGTTKINGEDVPTHIVTIANKDGSRTVVDSAKAQYQLLDLNTQLTHVDRARQTNMMATQHAETIALSREQLAQNARDSEASRGLQARQISQIERQFNATTPLGQITAKAQALGRKLSGDEIENMLGVSKIPRSVEIQVQSLMKENDTDSAAMAKAIASPEGMNPAAASTFQKNAAIRNERMSQLLGPYSGAGRAGVRAGSDPLKLGAAATGGVTVPNPMAPDGGAVLQQPGGVRAVLTPGAAAALSGRDIPAAPSKKAWVGNNYVDNPAYLEWTRRYGAAYQKGNDDATRRLDRVRN
jgi:hypothetical protein